MQREFEPELNRARWSLIRERMSSEFDLAILSVFGGSSAIVVGAFAIYRFMTNSIVGGVVDVAISVGLIAVVIFAWRGRSVAQAGAIFVGFCVLACLASSIVFGRTSAYWAFVVLSISFVVTGPRPALIGSLALVAAMAVQETLFNDSAERAIFVITAVLMTIYGWISKSRYDAKHRQLEFLANHDPLTQAGNRRLMQQTLCQAVEASTRTATPAMLAVLDLDHFKVVNDTHGHEKGDEVLVKLAQTIRERLQPGDSLFRLGGEEFVVLLSHANAERGQAVCSDLLRLFSQAMTQAGMPVTVSIGAASLNVDEDWMSWLNRADEAMYRAKQAGRNQVVID